MDAVIKPSELLSLELDIELLRRHLQGHDWPLFCREDGVMEVYRKRSPKGPQNEEVTEIDLWEIPLFILPLRKDGDDYREVLAKSLTVLSLVDSCDPSHFLRPIPRRGLQLEAQGGLFSYFAARVIKTSRFASIVSFSTSLLLLAAMGFAGFHVLQGTAEHNSRTRTEFANIVSIHEQREGVARTASEAVLNQKVDALKSKVDIANTDAKRWQQQLEMRFTLLEKNSATLLADIETRKNGMRFAIAGLLKSPVIGEVRKPLEPLILADPSLAIEVLLAVKSSDSGVSSKNATVVLGYARELIRQLPPSEYRSELLRQIEEQLPRPTFPFISPRETPNVTPPNSPGPKFQ